MWKYFNPPHQSPFRPQIIHIYLFIYTYPLSGSQVVLVVSNSPAKTGDVRDSASTPGLGPSSEGGYGNLFQYSCLENPMGEGTW